MEKAWSWVWHYLRRTMHRPQALAEHPTPAFELMADVNAVRDIVLFIRTDGRIIGANRTALQAYGYTLAELLSLCITDLRLPEDDTLVRRQLAAACRGSISFETRHRRKDGTTFPAEVSSSLLTQSSGRFLFTIVRDVSRRQQQQALTGLARDTTRALLNGQPVVQILSRLCEQLVAVCGADLVQVGLSAPDGSVPAPVQAGLPAGAQRPGSAVAFDVPLVALGETLGAITLFVRDPAIFDEETRRNLTELADQVSLSLIHAKNQTWIRLQTAALAATGNAVAIWDHRGRFTWVNPAWEKLTGYCLEDLINQTTAVLLSDRDSPQLSSEAAEAVATGRPWSGTLHLRRKTGGIFTASAAISPIFSGTGEITHVLGIVEDITDRIRLEGQLRYLATHDPLTGAPTLGTLREQLEQTVSRAAGGEPAALLLINLDDFRGLNHTLGRQTGDAVLSSAVSLMRQALRPDDLLARVSADEFAVVVQPSNDEAAGAVADRLRAAVTGLRFDGAHGSLRLTASIGLVMLDGSTDGETAMRLAEGALAIAKDRGKDQVFASAAGPADGAARPRQAWGTWVQEAVRQHQLVVHLQPVVDTRTGTVDHHEALVRLAGEDGATLRPKAFFQDAARLHLMPELDRWMFDRVLRLLEADPTLRIAVNIAQQSVGSMALLNHMEEQVSRVHLEPGRLLLEIDPGVALCDYLSLSEWMRRLNALGCAFTLDNFGSGYASIPSLCNLPIDLLKLDGPLVRDLLSSDANRQIVQAITAMAHALGRRVVAKWVESGETAAALVELGVDLGQGRWWGEPQPRQ
jgi:diguanylate cyclase (GGDEF)-like protein/PAS domain S-box-containing protein